MRVLEITFEMKNGRSVHATMNGNKEEVINEVTSYPGDFKAFGDCVVNMTEVLAMVVEEGMPVEEAEALDKAFDEGLDELYR
ncbi:hypothetical protein MKX66_30075 [Bacillus sp. FSL R9-9530]|uniref:hypothetical protein n=1 Tax=Bacillus TaxID=1386 RepID=UPI002E0A6B46|nr:hypothetical protein [Bacillus mycoides]MEC5267480.1 hypothetical protein [Bacillus mycoides]